jgi:hypothetical protein
VCVCAFSLHRESPDMILGDKHLISEVVLSQPPCRRLPSRTWLKGKARHPLTARVRLPWSPPAPQSRNQGLVLLVALCHRSGRSLANSWRRAAPPPPRARTWPAVTDSRAVTACCLQEELTPPAPRRPVPADLVGRCFNYLRVDHIAAGCFCAPWWLRCHREGHQAHVCKQPRSPKAAGPSA